jgi:hypothetical protein
VNPQVVDLLKRILQVLPSAGQALQGFTAGLRPFIQAAGGLTTALHNFIASAGGISGLLQSLAQTSIGRAAGTVAGGVGRFAAGAVSAAAGAGRAIAGGAAAFAASPFGQVTIASASVAAALVALGAATEKTGRTMLETQRNLANASPSMALVFAQSDIRKFFRENKAGEEQAGTAGFLAGALDKLADRLQPITTLLANISNLAGGAIAWAVEKILAPLTWIADGINSVIEWLGKILEKLGLIAEGERPATNGEVMQRMADADRANRQDVIQGRPMPSQFDRLRDKAREIQGRLGPWGFEVGTFRLND